MKYFTLAICCLGLAAACNNNGLGINNDAGGDKDMAAPKGSDLSVPKGSDLSMSNPKDGSTSGPQDLKGVSCGQQSCDDPQICCVEATGGTGFAAMCVAQGGCADGGLTALCDGPEDCPNSGQACCVNVNVSFAMGMSMNPSGSGGSACGDSCTASANVDTQTKMANVQSALCHKDADCVGLVGDVNSPLGMQTDQTFGNCCQAMQGGATLSFCAPDLVMTFGSFAGITCAGI